MPLEPKLETEEEEIQIAMTIIRLLHKEEMLLNRHKKTVTAIVQILLL
jgi:hypothetical protein